MLNRRGHEGQCYWRCANHMCPGRAITTENDELLSTKEHNHEGNAVEVEVPKVGCAMKERAKTETTPIPRLYQEAVRIVSQDEKVLATLPTFTSIRTMETTHQQNVLVF